MKTFKQIHAEKIADKLAVLINDYTYNVGIIWASAENGEICHNVARSLVIEPLRKLMAALSRYKRVKALAVDHNPAELENINNALRVYYLNVSNVMTFFCLQEII